MARVLIPWIVLLVTTGFVCGQIVFPADTTFLVSRPVVQQQNAGATCTNHMNKKGRCKRLFECFFMYTQLADLIKQTPCRLANQPSVFGVCCPNSESDSQKTSGVSSAGTLFFKPPDVPIPDLKPQDIQNAVQAALVVVEQRVELEKNLFNNRIVVQPDTAVNFHLNLFPTTSETLDVGKDAIKGLESSIQLVNQNMLTVDQGRFALPFFQASSSPLADTCRPQVNCPSPLSHFRTMDGSCNNEQRPEWGQINVALQRIIPPKYGDGVNTPRLAVGDVELPSARLVSQSLTESSHRSSQSETWTLMLMQWGQFLDHDITHSPLVRGQNSTGVTCCQRGQFLDASVRHPDCFPIAIPENDPFYAQFNQRCMEFVRSLPAPRPGCTFGPREQLNQVTAFIDGSTVYGSNDEAANQLREFNGGRLATQRSLKGHTLLPVKAEECSDFLRQRFCFRAGDGRVNEQPQLAVIHTLWVREHNRVADALQQLNPSWSDERVFQESRRIIGAEIQQITYNEFLPIFLGEDYMSRFQLKPLPANSGEPTNLYDQNINPTVTNEFATAAFRVGHSLVQGIIEGFTAFGSQTQSLLLHQHQSKPFELYEDTGVDTLVRGLLMQPAQKMDRAFTDELKNRLFQGKQSFGMDLIALNLQRGRDHGLPPYNDYRELCGRPRANQWQDLLDVIDQRVVQEMSRIYNSIDDVDLFIGGVSERQVEGALLGPTFLCLIGDQFARLRRGDRLFYEEATAQFTQQQLATLRSIGLARILCDNGDDIKSIQSSAFLRSDVQNRRRPCQGSSDIPELDLTLWRE
uniref:Chorion peroxidase n=1 Tax=Daphnia magna TaxID=35525 RepID=A0A0P5JUL6_9CRUS